MYFSILSTISFLLLLIPTIFSLPPLSDSHNILGYHTPYCTHIGFNGHVCTNISAHTCCKAPRKPWRSVEFQRRTGRVFGMHYRLDKHTVGEVYRADDSSAHCGEVCGKGRRCVNHGWCGKWITGASWREKGKKGNRGLGWEGQQGCRETVEPDVVVIEGRHFRISSVGANFTDGLGEEWTYEKVPKRLRVFEIRDFDV